MLQGTRCQIPETQDYVIQIDNTGKNPDTNPPTFGDALHNTGALYKLAAPRLPCHWSVAYLRD